MNRAGFVEHVRYGRFAFELRGHHSLRARESHVCLLLARDAVLLLGTARFSPSGDQACITLSRTLGVAETTVSQDPFDEATLTMEWLVARAISKWQELVELSLRDHRAAV